MWCKTLGEPLTLKGNMTAGQFVDERTVKEGRWELLVVVSV